jgi:ankyrin repeat protein
MDETVVQNFEWALKNGDMEQVKAIVDKEKALVNHQLPSGRYPLCMAADYGQTDIIQYLISQSADVNVVDRYGISPLLSAIYEGHTPCVKLLLEKGASKTGKAPDGSLYIDCTEDDAIKQLLK